MGQSLAEAAVRGTQPTTGLSTEARELLDAGDIEGLMAFHRRTFGGFVMEVDDDADEDDDDTDDGDDADEDDDEDDNEDNKSKKSAAQKRIEELSAEAKQHRKKASERGRRIRELEARLAELEKGSGKGKQGNDDEDDKSEEVTQLKSDFEKVLTDNEQLRIENAFLRNTKFQWKNPKAALKLADLTDVEINDDGEVEGLDDALEALAKSDPYLLAEKGKQGDDDDEDDDDKPKAKRTGQPTGKSKKGQPNRDKLIAKYPALRR